MSKISKYKWLNIILLIVAAIIYAWVYYLFSINYCVEGCNLDLKLNLLNPVYAGGHILIMSLAILLVFPADLFRRWLFYAGGPFFILSVIDISTIDTRGGSIVSPTRAGMAELSGQLLLALTILFIVGYYGWFWYKNRRQNKQK